MKFSNHLKIVSLIPIEIVMEILTFFVVPFALLFCSEKDTRLPRLFRMWDDYKYGINGDQYWQGPEHANGQQTKYIWRVKWLYRNRMNTFSHEVTGVDMTTCNKRVSYDGDIATTNTPFIHPGKVLVTVTTDKGTYQTFYCVIPWSSRFCLRVYWGWKTRDWAEPGRYDEAMESRQNAQFVWYVNPFCSVRRIN